MPQFSRAAQSCRGAKSGRADGCYPVPMRELFTDTWRIVKLTAAIVAGPLLVWGVLVWAGVLK